MPYLTETELSNYFQTIDQQAAELARLTAGNEATQETTYGMFFSFCHSVRARLGGG